MLFLTMRGCNLTKHLFHICTMLDQRRRRWANVVQMLYKCFVFAGMGVPGDYTIQSDIESAITVDNFC